MKQRPILFSAPMVRALLDGSKTQTRRVCKHAMDTDLSAVVGPFEIPGHGSGWFGDEEGDVQFLGPYGQPGDHLWVRETFYAYGRWVTRYSEKKRRDEWHFLDMTVECDRRYQYAADNPDVPLATGRGGVLPGWYMRPAIFMPRAACRIALEITGVRVERLQDISESDAIAEGIEKTPQGFWSLYGQHDANGTFNPRTSFRALWQSINGAEGWDANPWCWCIGFKRVAP